MAEESVASPFKEDVPAPKAPARRKRKSRARPRAASTPGRKPASKDLSQGLGMAYAMAGSMIAYRDPPVGRIMQIQAPVAGKSLHKIVKEHDVLYAVLSPIFGQTEVMELSKVIGPPLMVAVMERRPELMPVLRPMLMPMLLELYREVNREMARQREAIAAITEETEDEMDAGFEQFVEALGLAGPFPPDQPEPEPEPEGAPEPVVVVE